MNVLTLGQHDAAGNQVPAPPHTCYLGVALRGLARVLVGRLGPVRAVLLGDGGEAPTTRRPPRVGTTFYSPGPLLGRKTMMLYHEVASESIER